METTMVNHIIKFPPRIGCRGLERQSACYIVFLEDLGQHRQDQKLTVACNALASLLQKSLCTCKAVCVVGKQPRYSPPKASGIGLGLFELLVS